MPPRSDSNQACLTKLVPRRIGVTVGHVSRPLQDKLSGV